MSDNDLSSKVSPAFGRRQQSKEARRVIVGGNVTPTEKDEILDAIQQSGFSGQSNGVRGVMLAFVRSAEVRDAVSQALKEIKVA